MKKSKSKSICRSCSPQVMLALALYWAADGAYGQQALPQPSATLGPVDALQAWPESDTVRELLRSDAAAALAAQRYQKAADWIQTGKPSLVAQAAPMGKQPDVLGVKAIYGVGKTLQAELAINGHLVRSRPGQQVRDVHGAAASYVVLAIEGSCVRLRKGSETKITCLTRSEQP